MEDLATSLQPLFAALAEAMLALAVGVAVLRPACPASRHTGMSRLQGLAVLVLGLVQFFYFWVGAIAMTQASGADVPAALWQVLTASHFGAMQVVAGFAWLLLAAGSWLPLLRTRQHVFIAGVLLYVFARAASGHAMEQGLASVAVFTQCLHVLAGVAWVGCVAVCAGLALMWRQWTPVQRAALGQRVSTAATLALIAVAGTGLMNCWRLLGAPDAIMAAWPASDYLHLLAAKLVCVALALSLGAYNRWHHLPGLHLSDGLSDDAARRFAVVLLIETLALGLALYAAAQLGATMPPQA